MLVLKESKMPGPSADDNSRVPLVLLLAPRNSAKSAHVPFAWSGAVEHVDGLIGNAEILASIVQAVAVTMVANGTSPGCSKDELVQVDGAAVAHQPRVAGVLPANNPDAMIVALQSLDVGGIHNDRKPSPVFGHGLYEGIVPNDGKAIETGLLPPRSFGRLKYFTGQVLATGVI